MYIYRYRQLRIYLPDIQAFQNCIGYDTLRENHVCKDTHLYRIYIQIFAKKETAR